MQEEKRGRKEKEEEIDEEGRGEWRERGEPASVAVTRTSVGPQRWKGPRWLVLLDSSKSGIGYDKYRSGGIKSTASLSAWPTRVRRI